MHAATPTRPRVLVAEDDPTLADLVRINLSHAGYEVRVVANGLDALKLTEELTFDVIISDYEIPLINGEDLLRQIRDKDPACDAILILCTAKSFELDTERLRRELKLDAVICKPFSFREMTSIIQTELNRRTAILALAEA